MKAKLIIITLAAMSGAAMMVPPKTPTQLSADQSISVAVLAPAEPVPLGSTVSDWLPVAFTSGQTEREAYRSEISDHEAIEIAIRRGTEIADARGPGVRIPGLRLSATNSPLTKTIKTYVETSSNTATSEIANQSDERVDDAALPWRVTASRVNLRAGPSTNDDIVGVAETGDTMMPLSGVGSSWIEVMRDNGSKAWIFAKFLEPTQG